METSTTAAHYTHLASSPALSALDTMASSPSDLSPHYLKMEDLHASSAASPAPSTFEGVTAGFSQTSPPPVIIQSKPAKKRKSWGQELPEPTTTLPPRKRAKTDDEKEQRRIERIKRNRAAAHNSRERKRQETETLAVALAKAKAELDAYRKLHGPLPASIVLPEVTLCTEDYATPAPSLTESRDAFDDCAPSPATPAHDATFSDFNHIKEESLDPTFDSHIHPSFLNNLHEKPSPADPAFLPLDLTQHSAAMLCDLPCRSRSSPKRSNNPTFSTPNNPTFSSPTSTTPRSAAWWSFAILCFLTSQLRTTYKTLLMAMWTVSPSRMARMMRASTLNSSRSMSSSTPRRLVSQSTPRRLALPSAATGQGAPRLPRRQELVGAVTADGRRGVRQALVREGCERVLALREQTDEGRSTSDGGDEKNGVRRETSE